MNRFAIACTLLLCSALVVIVAHGADQAEPVIPQAAIDALNRGRTLKQRGLFDQAREQFQFALEAAPLDSEIREQAKKELEFQLPLMEIQYRVNTGDWDGVERILEQLAIVNREHPERLQQISVMSRNLELMRGAATVPGIAIDHNAVVQEVRRIFEMFRRSNGRYPIGYRELNTVLPANEPPLEYFVVNHYSGQGEGYVLVLRNRHDPKQTVTLQNTGLLR